MKKDLLGFVLIIVLGAALTVVHWSLLIIAGIIGGYFIESVKKSAVFGFIGGILAWLLLFIPYVLSGYFSAVNSFINAVAGIPALPLTLVIGGILALLGTLMGNTGKKVFK